jgi:hypothetical protein
MRRGRKGRGVVEEELKKHGKYFGVGFAILLVFFVTILSLGGMIYVTVNYPILLFYGSAFLFLSWGLGRIIEK